MIMICDQMTQRASWPNIYFIYTVPKVLTLKISFISEKANKYFRAQSLIPSCDEMIMICDQMTQSASWPNIYFIYTVPKVLTLKISFISEKANKYFRT